MDYRELHRFSRTSLKGHYAAAMRTSWLMPSLHALYKLIPAGLAGLLVLRGTMPPAAFWRGGWLWMTFLALWMLFCGGLMLPVQCAVWSWFGSMLGLSPCRRCFSRIRDYARAAWVMGLAEGLRILAALPVAASGVFALVSLRESVHSEHGALWLFAAVQAVAAMLWTSVYYLRLRVSLTAVPVLFLRAPKRSAFSHIRTAICMMDGHHRELWAIWLGYLPMLLTILPIPFVLPYLYTNTALFWQVRIREFTRDHTLLMKERRASCLI